MANHQINITENGTKILLTAQKYCDRNIDVNVNVNVATNPTQFTNILDLDTTIVKKGYRVTSSQYTATADTVAIVCLCPKGAHRIRVRGKYTWGYFQPSIESTSATGLYRANLYQATNTPTESAFAGTGINNVATSTFRNAGEFNQDEYGDFYLDITTTDDCYIGFTLKDMSVIYPNSSFMNPIITIDEPIGNGGIV